MSQSAVDDFIKAFFDFVGGLKDAVVGGIQGLGGGQQPPVQQQPVQLQPVQQQPVQQQPVQLQPVQQQPVQQQPVQQQPVPQQPVGPMSQDDLRLELQNIDPSQDYDNVVKKTAAMLDDFLKDLEKHGGMVTLDSRAAMIDEMARTKNISREEVAGMVKENKGRGFTAPDGTVYVCKVQQGEEYLADPFKPGDKDEVLTELNAAVPHDKVHETVHLMSAPGGATKILNDYGEPLNEACTEYFAKKMCAELGVPDAAAYEGEVQFLTKVIAKVGEAKVYTAYMQDGGFQPIEDDLYGFWLAKDTVLMSKMATKAFAPPKQKGTQIVDPAEARKKLKDRLRDPKVNEKFWTNVLA